MRRASPLKRNQANNQSASVCTPARTQAAATSRGGVPGSGSVAKLDDDLNLDTGDAFEGGLWVGYGRHRATLGYEHDPFEGTSRLTRQVIYRGTAFPAGTAIRSDVSLSIWKLGYDYAFLDGRSTEAERAARESLDLLTNTYGVFSASQNILIFAGIAALGFLLYRMAGGTAGRRLLPTIAVISFVLVLAGEIVGRMLFYASMVRIGV